MALLRRNGMIWLLTGTLLLTACGSRPAAEPPQSPQSPQPSQPSQPAPAAPAAPDLARVSAPGELEFGPLVAGLERYLAQGEGSPAQRLTGLYQRWGLRPLEQHRLLVEADLDGDGETEVVTALNGSGSVVGMGHLLVIDRREGQVVIDRPGGEPLSGAALIQVLDLTGDGQPEIVASSTAVGAHTAHTELLVYRWQPGRFERLPGAMVTSNARVAVEGEDLLLAGGMVSSVGAGAAQRLRTDRYRWVTDSFRLVDQQFAPSSYGYHRLIDGIAADTYGRKGEAETAFREAMEEGREVLPGAEPGLAPAVRTFARFRLAALLQQEGRGEEAAQVGAGASGPFAGLTATLAEGCGAAERWVEENPAFLEALNSPQGYNNYLWQPPDICGPLPPLAP